jgi:hypothetical protein
MNLKVNDALLAGSSINFEEVSNGNKSFNNGRRYTIKHNPQANDMTSLIEDSESSDEGHSKPIYTEQ